MLIAMSDAAALKEPLVPLVIFVVVMLIFGLHSGPLVDIFAEIASELATL